jgi:hypothetical protein
MSPISEMLSASRDRQFADPGPVEQVAQAMIELADQQQNLARGVAAAQLPAHPIGLGQRFKAGANRLRIGTARIERDPHEEIAVFQIVELLGLQNIPAFFRKIAGYAGGDPGLVAA